ncbi:T9SS type A sorting domain-containing protein [Hymenobacter koreensis]|uniref:Delta-60 repeat domain-containing protein n=1 Tax=Hymenobacter koreensis TaxID=1084523 RepID=A0ABP8IXL1_9BACT
MTKLLRLGWLLGLWLAFCAGAQAQSLDPAFQPVNLYQTAVVNAVVQQPDGKYVISGNFVRINGTPAFALARLNADGTLDTSFSLNASTSAVSLTLLPNGQVLAFGPGLFIINGQNYPNLVRLNANGTLDAGFNVGTGAAGGPPRSVAVQPDGKVVMVGAFTTFNGVPAPGIVRLNQDGSVDQGLAGTIGSGFTGGDAYVVAVEPNGRLVVGGRFTNFNNSGRQKLVRLLPTGALDTSYNPVVPTNAPGPVYLALDPVTNQAVVGGLGNGELVRLNTDGSQDQSFQSTATSYCISFGNTNSTRLVVDNNRRILLARACTGTSGLGSEPLTRLLPDGSVDPQFNVQNALDGTANVIFRQPNGEVVVGGSFKRFGSLVNVSLVRLDNAGQPSATFRPVLDSNGIVYKVLRQADGKLLVGGVFREIDGQPAGNLVRLNADGSRDASYAAPEFDGLIESMALQPDGKLVVAGAFNTVGGTTSSHLVRLLPTGALDTGFRSFAAYNRNSVRGLELEPNGNILVGFTSNNTLAGRTGYLHRLQPDGQPDPFFGQNIGTGPAGSVGDIALLADGRLYVAGFFTRFNNIPAEGLVRLLPDGTLDPSFVLPSVPLAASKVIEKVLPLANGQVLVGGSFTSFGGVARNNVVRLNANGTVDPAFNASIVGGGAIDMVVQPNGRILVGAAGAQSVSGLNQGSLFRINGDGTLDNGFVASPELINGTVYSLLVQPDGKLLIGGNIVASRSSAQPQFSLVRLTNTGILSTGQAKAEQQLAVWPVPAHDVLHVHLPNAQLQSLQLLDALGRSVRTFVPTAGIEQQVNVRGLQPGVYLLRAGYTGSTATRRVVIE